MPIIALGGGVTLAAVLNILQGRIQVHSVCPPNDFVRFSRWYRPLSTGLPNPRPKDLGVLLRDLEIESAVLLPCSDDWLRAVSSLPPDLAQRFPSSIPADVDGLIDKWRFSRMLKEHRIPSPRTSIIRCRSDLSSLAEWQFEGAILKPLASVEFAGKHGVKGFLVHSRAQAEKALQAIELPIMLQEFVPGPPSSGYFLDGFRDRLGRITGLFARRRLRMHPAKLGNSTFIESVALSEVQDTCSILEYLLPRISYRGVFSAEFKFDKRDNQFKLIEINARPWWYVEFAYRCGVDVCSMAYQDALCLPVEPVGQYQLGRRCVFHLNDLRAWKQSQATTRLRSILATWIGAESTPFHWNDPVPALAYLGRSLCDLAHPKPCLEILRWEESPVHSSRPNHVDTLDPVDSSSTLSK